MIYGSRALACGFRNLLAGLPGQLNFQGRSAANWQQRAAAVAAGCDWLRLCEALVEMCLALGASLFTIFKSA
jgi:hypothetical protein